jgi:hypothetical protein
MVVVAVVNFSLSKEFPMLGIIFCFSIGVGLIQGFSGK